MLHFIYRAVYGTAMRNGEYKRSMKGTSHKKHNRHNNQRISYMASEYIKYQLRDVKPQEAPAPLTRKEKIKNWFDYYKWFLAAGIVLAVIIIDFAHSTYVTSHSRPDYTIGYVGSHLLPEDTVRALEEAIAAIAPDADGNGKVIVSVVQYAKDIDNSADDTAAGYNSASEVRLMADLEQEESDFFLLEDPEKFQEDYAVLMPLSDGSYARPFSDLSALSDYDFGTYEDVVSGQTVTGKSADLLKGLCFGQRMPRETSSTLDMEANNSLFNLLRGGN